MNRTIEFTPEMVNLLELVFWEMSDLMSEVDEHRFAHVDSTTLTEPERCDQEVLHKLQCLIAEIKGEK